MTFRQLIDPETSTYSYLLGDEPTREAVLIDPVLEQIERDCALVGELGLRLHCVLETHVHADHVTASGRLRRRLGARIGAGACAGVRNGRTVSMVTEEKRFNPRLGLDVCLEEFREIMAHVDLAAPKRIAVAVPANLQSGLAPCPV